MVKGHEVAYWLQLLAGSQALSLVEVEPQKPPYNGLYTLRLKTGWSITLFCDSGEVDYCHEAIAPDGRTGSFVSWEDLEEEPVSLLSYQEQLMLQTLLFSIE